MKFEVTRIKGDDTETKQVFVATEIPLTIVANEVEIATIMCTPTYLKELTTGFLFTSGFIKDNADILDYHCDEKTWCVNLTISKTPDAEVIRKRLYTSGCGRGLMYSNMIEIASRHPIENALTVTKDQLVDCIRWLQSCSALYKETGAVHSAALSIDGYIPDFYIDDVGRHNAVDKVIGYCILNNLDFSNSLILSTGRTSQEILHKTKIAGIPISVSRGAPTHQTILRAQEMGVTVVGFARGGGFTVYSHKRRIIV